MTGDRGPKLRSPVRLLTPLRHAKRTKVTNAPKAGERCARARYVQDARAAAAAGLRTSIDRRRMRLLSTTPVVPGLLLVRPRLPVRARGDADLPVVQRANAVPAQRAAGTSAPGAGRARADWHAAGRRVSGKSTSLVDGRDGQPAGIAHDLGHLLLGKELAGSRGRISSRGAGA